MKMKISLDKNSLKNFFLDHVEKVVFGVFLLIALLICYFGFASRESLSLTPRDLERKVQDAQNVIAKQKENAANAITDYAHLAESSRARIDDAPYASTRLWRPNLWALQRPRGKPAVLTAEEPNVSIHMVAVGNSNAGGAAGGSATKGARFVAVTALVPVKKQNAAFNDAFREALGYDEKDVPIHVGFNVQRVELPPGVDPQNADWTAAKIIDSATALEEATENSSGSGSDVVDTAYVLPGITQPLIALAHGQWEKNVAHEPQIPFLAPKRENSDMPPQGPGPAPGPAAPRRPGVRPTQAANAVETTEMLAADKVEYKLLRFLDFKAEPGKRYAYRLQLVLDNPNYQRPSNILESSDLAKDEFLKSDWSAPTSPIAIPPDTRLFAVSVKSRPGLDPQGTILLLKWDETTGMEVFKEKEALERGKLLRFKGEEVKVRGALAEHGVQPTADLDAKAVVLDMIGGKKLSGRGLTSPADVLVLNFDGSFVLLNELDDMAQIEQITKEPEKAVENTGEGGLLGPPAGPPPLGAKKPEPPKKPDAKKPEPPKKADPKKPEPPKKPDAKKPERPMGP